MRATGWLRRNAVEVAWAAFAVANLAAMIRWEAWETIPFHFIWVSLTLLYGFRVWRNGETAGVLTAVCASTGILITVDISHGTQEWGELFEVPLMSAMFLAMVWHARRRQQAIRDVEALAENRASLLERQERFLHDVSHELRTPVTIAQGHLELLRRLDGPGSPEIDVAVDELGRIERILDRLLLIAQADRPDFLARQPIELEPFLEEVFMRWSEVAPRRWQLGQLDGGTLFADPDTVRIALDALLENAVKYTEQADAVSLSCRAGGGEVAIEVSDSGSGIDADALERIFDRFGRADAARSRSHGGVGLGLAIVDAIAKAHGGSCSVRSSPRGTAFTLVLPGYKVVLERWRGERVARMAGRSSRSVVSIPSAGT